MVSASRNYVAKHRLCRYTYPFNIKSLIGVCLSTDEGDRKVAEMHICLEFVLREVHSILEEAVNYVFAVQQYMYK